MINMHNIKSSIMIASHDKLCYLKITDKSDKIFYCIKYDNEILSCDIIDIYDEFMAMITLYKTLINKGELK